MRRMGPADTGQDRRAGYARGSVRCRRCRWHARRRTCDPRTRRHGGWPQDRNDQGFIGCKARRRGQLGAQAGRAGQGRHPGRPTVGRRRNRGQGLLEDAAAGDLHQRFVGRAGDDPDESVAKLLPLQHRRRPVDGRPRRRSAQARLQESDDHCRGLLVPVLAGPRLHDRVLRRRRQGSGQGVGAARRQGLFVGDRAHSEGRRCAGRRARAVPTRSTF